MTDNTTTEGHNGRDVVEDDVGRSTTIHKNVITCRKVIDGRRRLGSTM